MAFKPTTTLEHSILPALVQAVTISIARITWIIKWKIINLLCFLLFSLCHPIAEKYFNSKFSRTMVRICVFISKVLGITIFGCDLWVRIFWGDGQIHQYSPANDIWHISTKQWCVHIMWASHKKYLVHILKRFFGKFCAGKFIEDYSYALRLGYFLKVAGIQWVNDGSKV